jgi:hypothetical protein
MVVVGSDGIQELVVDGNPAEAKPYIGAEQVRGFALTIRGRTA